MNLNSKSSLKEVLLDITPAAHLDKVHQVLDKALSHSANVFSQFLGKTVSFTISGIHDFFENEIVNSDKNLNVIVSDLKGDVKGRSYLIFKDNDATNLVKTCLSPEYAQDLTMQSAILLELDNILTAAVVTNLVNSLKINSYAYVPAQMNLTPSQLRDNLENDFHQDCLLITINTQFNVDNLAISPMFIWALELKLIDIISETTI
ncbi:MAG: hypothetical protein SFY32_04700 [Bacteroidota bacterium]|nr:hypothetical protein [Bacteroidota bacterium]